MVKLGEALLHLARASSRCPQTFWERSLFAKPQDREVVCHASAWDVDNDDDLRIKMCIEINDEDLITIHHELGHNYYQHAYYKQPILFRNGANDGFHEAIGDTIALSSRPSYLKKIGLLDQAPTGTRATSTSCMQHGARQGRLPAVRPAHRPVALGRVLRRDQPERVQRGLVGAARRSTRASPRPCRARESDFDPGAKYHVPANVPYTRYFLAHILQFQFHRALCREAGFTGPAPPVLDLRQQGGGREAATRCWRIGASKPWPDALEALTGERQMDATAILDYFAPLKKWLDEQNKGRTLGWQ